MGLRRANKTRWLKLGIGIRAQHLKAEGTPKHATVKALRRCAPRRWSGNGAGSSESCHSLMAAGSQPRWPSGRGIFIPGSLHPIIEAENDAFKLVCLLPSNVDSQEISIIVRRWP